MAADTRHNPGVLSNSPLSDKSGLNGGFAARSLLSGTGEGPPPSAALWWSQPLTVAVGDDRVLSPHRQDAE